MLYIYIYTFVSEFEWCIFFKNNFYCCYCLKESIAEDNAHTNTYITRRAMAKSVSMMLEQHKAKWKWEKMRTLNERNWEKRAKRNAENRFPSETDDRTGNKGEKNTLVWAMSCTPVTNIKCPSYHTHISPTTTPLRRYYHHSLFTLRTHTHIRRVSFACLSSFPVRSRFPLCALVLRVETEIRKLDWTILFLSGGNIKTNRAANRPAPCNRLWNSSFSFFLFFHFLVYGLAVTRAASNNQKTQYKYNNQRQYISDDVSYGQMIRKRNRSPSIFCRTQEKLHRLWLHTQILLFTATYSHTNTNTSSKNSIFSNI